MQGSIEFLNAARGRIAYRLIDGRGPTIMWFGGFKSDMSGAKAEALGVWAASTVRSYLRFDYSGHGASEGRFEDGTISAWLDDALAVIDQVAKGPLILVGSSMGGWIATLAALRRKDRVAGIVYIAPAPDFTEILIWDEMTEDEREIVQRDGRLIEHSIYSDEPTIITRALIEDGRRHLILGGPIELRCPIRILQGMADPDVPWRHAAFFAEKLAAVDLEMTLIKSGDHRLSKPHEIAKIVSTIDAIADLSK
jgi:pimeloyl-ACP methyl ester carboxylesterase